MKVRVVDTLPAFQRYWEAVRLASVEQQIDRWASVYLADWPELASKQQADYASQALDWRQVARARVFASLDQWLPAMLQAGQGLRRCLAPTACVVGGVIGVDLEVLCVLHVGIGCGAGWATTFADRPAVLFGLENAAEQGWVEEDTLVGLAAHEFGHVAHAAWRRRAGLTEGHGPWWRLVEEGIAQRCEAAVLGDRPGHLAGEDGAWLSWCRDNRGRLARAYLDAARAGGPFECFFGSWFAFDGHSHTGYYLGEQIVERWEQEQDLAEIACTPVDVLDARAARTLEALAGEG
jgi:hypothetical protein